MSTRISVDAVSAVGSLSAFRNAIRGASDAWRAQEAALRNSGNYVEAAKARLSGLNQVIDLQKAKVEELRQRQGGLDISNKKQANQFLKLEKQIQQANRQLASYESQAERARNAARYQISGLAALQNSYHKTQAASQIYVKRLQTEGKVFEAIEAKSKGLRQGLSNLESQYRKQEFLLRRVVNEGGKNSESYIKQREQLDKTATSIAKAKAQLEQLNQQLKKQQIAAIHQTSGLDALQKAYQQSQSISSSYVARLEAEGKVSDSIKVKQHSLADELQNLKLQYNNQQNVMKQVANQSGKNSEAYAKEEVTLNKIATAIAETTKQEAEQRKALSYHASGLANLQHQMKMSEAVSRSYVSSLRAQGKTSKADRVELNGLRESLSSLEKQQSKQRSLLKQVERQSGKTSDAYRKQQIELNRTSESIAKTQTRMKDLDKSLNPPRVSSWGYIRNEILRVDEAEKKAKASVINYGQALKANILGGWISSGLTNLTTGIKGVIINGMAAAKVGAAMEARWKNIGMAAGGVKQLSAQVGDLKTNTYLSAQSVNALQTRFYGMTHSVQQTKQLTQSVGSLSDKLKLSEQQSNAFAGGLSRIESSGKVSSQTLGRLEKQAPGLTAALQKTSGMSKQAFNDLLSSGKMTADQFNQLMVKASGDYKKNAAGFSQTSGGAMHKLRAEWTTTQAKLAKPLLKVSSTGLNELSQALNNKDTQRGLQMLGKGMANVAVDAAKFIGFLAKHQKTVKVFGATILGLAAAFKTMQGTVIAVDIVSRFAKLKGTAKVIGLVTNNVKMLGTAVKVATLGFNPWIIAIGAVAAGFTLLYKHSKKFRNFVNGLVKSAKSGMHKVGQWFSSTFKKINSDQQKSNRAQQKANQQNQRAWNNYWKQHNRAAEQNQRKLERAEQASQRRRSRAIANFNKDVVRKSNNTWKSLQRDVNNGARGTERAWENIERSAQRGSKNVGRWYAQMEKNTGRTIQRMNKEHPRIFGAMYKVIEDRSRTWHDLVTGHWDRLNNDTQNTAKDMSNAHRQLFGAMYDKLNDLTHGGLDQMRDYWSNTLNKIHDAVVNIGGTIHKAFDSLMNGLIDIFSGLVNGIVDGINWVLNHVGGDGNLQKVNLKHFAKGSNGPITKHQLAVLNDAPDNDYREMVHKHKTGETFMLPAKRNIMMPLEPGDEVLDGKRVAQMMKLMGTPVHHANGAIGDFFSGLWNGAKDIEEMAEDALKNVVGFGKSLFSHFIKSITPKSTDSLNSALKVNLPGFFANRLKNWLKKQLELLDADSQGVISSDKFVRIAKHAAALMHQKLSNYDIARLYHQAFTESGVNAGQNGGYDDHDGTGLPIGLFQFKVGTWRAATRHLPANHHNIHSALDQIMAVLADTTWRSDIEQLGEKRGWSPHGYAYGGIVSQHGLYEVAENNNPEMIVPLDPNKRGRAYQLLTQVLSRFKGEEGNVESTDNGTSQQVQNLGRKFDALLAQNQQMINLIDKLIGVTDSANNPTARYRRTQRDINMAQAQSLVR